jgi:hypothetical protein
VRLANTQPLSQILPRRVIAIDGAQKCKTITR